jgi:hypothetical protein
MLPLCDSLSLVRFLVYKAQEKGEGETSLKLHLHTPTFLTEHYMGNLHLPTLFQYPFKISILFFDRLIMVDGLVAGVTQNDQIGKIAQSVASLRRFNGFFVV